MAIVSTRSILYMQICVKLNGVHANLLHIYACNNKHWMFSHLIAKWCAINFQWKPQKMTDSSANSGQWQLFLIGIQILFCHWHKVKYFGKYIVIYSLLATFKQLLNHCPRTYKVPSKLIDHMVMICGIKCAYHFYFSWSHWCHIISSLTVSHFTKIEFHRFMWISEIIIQLENVK